MTSGGNLVIFMMLFFYLALATGISTMMILDKDSVTTSSLMIDIGSINSVKDSGFNNSVVNQSLHGVTEYSGIWFLNSDGSYTLEDASIATGIQPTLVIDKVISTNGIYTNEYKIDNVPLKPFNIIIRKSASEINFLDNIVLVFDNDFLHIPSNLIGDDYALPVTNLIATNNMKIKTVFDSKLNTLDVYLDGGLLAHVNNLHSLSGLSISHFYYCGVQSYNIGFKWVSVSTVIGTETATDFISVAGNFFNTVWSLFNFTMPSEYYPIPLERVILFDVPLFGLIVFAIMLFRGV